VAYNLGDSKIMINDIQNPADCETLILNLPADQRFEGFVEFKKFDDIGFFPGNLSIESCSHFLYITSDVKGKSKLNNRLNLLFIDKFNKN
jgi:hypothetical protein